MHRVYQCARQPTPFRSVVFMNKSKLNCSHFQSGTNLKKDAKEQQLDVNLREQTKSEEDGESVLVI